MSPPFTDDDVGKWVENATGEKIGIVTAVDRDAAHVDPEPRTADSIKAKLGWEDEGDETVPLTGDAVDEITDDAIRLEREPAVRNSSIDGDAGGDSSTDATVERDERADRRDVGPTGKGDVDDARSPADGESDPDSDTETDDRPPEGDRTVTDEWEVGDES